MTFAGLKTVAGESGTRASFYTRAKRPDGRERHFSIAVEVRDETLLKRLKSISVGSQITLTTQTDWDEELMSCVLVDFVADAATRAA